MGWTGRTVASPFVTGKGMSHFPNGQSMAMLDMCRGERESMAMLDMCGGVVEGKVCEHHTGRALNSGANLYKLH